MPYIKQEDRQKSTMTTTSLPTPKTAGELNYVFTLISKHYFQTNGANYQVINDVVGALDGAKVEFQRRIVAPYEDKKIAENGDVY